jgi:hypothetical protein
MAPPRGGSSNPQENKKIEQEKLIEVQQEQASNQKEENFSLNQLTEEIKNKDLREVAPTVGAPPIDEETVTRVVKRLAHKCFLSPINALASICLLCLKGAASKSAPDKMFVEIVALDGQLTKVFKGDLMKVLFDTTGNRFIRRLAETLAVTICTFAERNKLSGDLAFTFEIEEVSDGRPPLTDKEKAWSNSFCQHVSDLENLASPRVKALLGLDYQKRFSVSKKKKAKAQERKTPTAISKKNQANQETPLKQN